jgi:hypothetical protein
VSLPTVQDRNLVLYENNIAQPVVDQIKVGTRAYNISIGATVKFKMREYDSSTLKVDAAATITNASSGEVSYDWILADVDTPGQYYGWWEITDAGSTLETNEFLIIIASHKPGLRTETGKIYQAAKSFLPITWNRLQESEHYGDAQLQNQIDVAKLSLLGYAVTAEDEANLDIRVINYIAKLTVISVIPAGKDYWASMAQTKSAGQPDESVSYPDRINMLDQLKDQLAKELADDRAIIGDILEIPQVRRSNDIPDTSDGTDEGYITPNPHTHFRDYGFSVGGNNQISRWAVRRRYW